MMTDESGLAVWSAGIEAIQFQTAQSQFVYSYFSFYSQIVKDELAVLQRRTAVELPAETRITFTFCSPFVILFLSETIPI